MAIIRTAKKILTFKKANVTPMAKASIDVATASGSIALKEKSGSQHSSSPNASLIIFRPISDNNIKAIQ